MYFVGRTGLIRLFIGGSGFVDNDPPPIDYYLVNIYR